MVGRPKLNRQLSSWMKATPFLIARYRKEATGELDETVIRALSERLVYLRSLQNRKEEISRLIEAQEKLTPEISASIRRLTPCRNWRISTVPSGPSAEPERLQPRRRV